MGNEIKWSKTGLIGGGGSDLDGIDGATITAGDYAFVGINGLMHLFKANGASSAATNSPFNIAPATNPGTVRWELQQTFPFGANVHNLKPVVNAAVNKLDIFAKSSGLAPAGNNIIGVSIPDGNGNSFRTRGAAYLSGTSQIVMADAANYWSKGSLDAEIKTAWLYAIWDGTGIVWALGGYSGFNVVPTTTTATDDDYFLLEDGSTYTRNSAHFCVAVTKIRYQYDTADTPDHTIQASGGNAPMVKWNPKSDYGYQKNLSSDITSAGDMAASSILSLVVKQSGVYNIIMDITANNGTPNAWAAAVLYIKTGNATYASAVERRKATGSSARDATIGAVVNLSTSVKLFLDAGDTIHMGAGVTSSAGTRTISATDTGFNFTKTD